MFSRVLAAGNVTYLERDELRARRATSRGGRTETSRSTLHL